MILFHKYGQRSSGFFTKSIAHKILRPMFSDKTIDKNKKLLAIASLLSILIDLVFNFNAAKAHLTKFKPDLHPSDE